MQVTRSGTSQSAPSALPCSRHSGWCSTRVLSLGSHMSRFVLASSLSLALGDFSTNSVGLTLVGLALLPPLLQKPSAATSRALLPALLKTLVLAPSSTSTLAEFSPLTPVRSAQWRAVSPSLLTQSRGWWALVRMWTTSPLPARAAQWRGVEPVASLASALAPAFMRALTIPPATPVPTLYTSRQAAAWRGVKPSSSGASASEEWEETTEGGAEPWMVSWWSLVLPLQ
mmetsp:Transcript_32413/g.64178  ORF Transcript_32413/g.64178 Transcript_32413/m.64178 type:complete len:228 (+) Transcript_32413:292-975(+)